MKIKITTQINPAVIQATFAEKIFNVVSAPIKILYNNVAGYFYQPSAYNYQVADFRNSNNLQQNDNYSGLQQTPSLKPINQNNYNNYQKYFNQAESPIKSNYNQYSLQQNNQNNHFQSKYAQQYCNQNFYQQQTVYYNSNNQLQSDYAKRLNQQYYNNNQYNEPNYVYAQPLQYFTPQQQVYNYFPAVVYNNVYTQPFQKYYQPQQQLAYDYRYLNDKSLLKNQMTENVNKNFNNIRITESRYEYGENNSPNNIDNKKKYDDLFPEVPLSKSIFISNEDSNKIRQLLNEKIQKQR